MVVSAYIAKRMSMKLLEMPSIRRLKIPPFSLVNAVLSVGPRRDSHHPPKDQSIDHHPYNHPSHAQTTHHSIIKPIQRRIRHLKRSHLLATQRRLPPRRLNPIHLPQPPTNPRPHIPQTQPIHRPKILQARRSGARVRRRGDGGHLLRDQEPCGAEVEGWLAGGVEVVVAEGGDAVLVEEIGVEVGFDVEEPH